MDDELVMTEYVYKGLTGTRYNPVNKGGQWYVGSSSMSFLNLMALLQIDDEHEIIMLKLKYGG